MLKGSTTQLQTTHGWKKGIWGETYDSDQINENKIGLCKIYVITVLRTKSMASNMHLLE